MVKVGWWLYLTNGRAHRSISCCLNPNHCHLRLYFNISPSTPVHTHTHTHTHTSATRNTRAKNVCLRRKRNNSKSISSLFYQFIKVSCFDRQPTTECFFSNLQLLSCSPGSMSGIVMRRSEPCNE